jgi:peptidase M15-like protein
MKMKWFDVDKDFKCPCGSPTCSAPIRPHSLLAYYLDVVRDQYGQPIIVTSGNRCPEHNRLEGGEDPSEHVWAEGCLGVDIRCSGSQDRARLLDAVRHAGLTRVGIYAAHLHIGCGDYVASNTFPGMVAWVPKGTHA